MQKSILFLLVVGLLSFTSDTFVKVKLNNKVTIFIPKGFTPMTKEDIKIRYQSYRLPLALYSDPSRLVDFGINRSFTKWKEKDFTLMAQFYEASLIEFYDKVSFINKGITEVNGHRFLFFEFNSFVYPINDHQGSIKKYTYLMYGLSGGVTYLFDFTCDKHSQERWQPVARSVMSLVKLKK